MEVILEILFMIFVEVVLWTIIAFPGAVIIWLIKKRKDSLKKILDKRLSASIFLGLIFWITIFVLLVKVFNL